ncbi:hypothetical protein IFR04_003131 [Cadophora malorum]|uniref:Uncharacterized protein n=1 Tax=Cadophora malorum TaxID=108018 RepID=A0A8H7WFA5_9HELO|nr:hypothetical protein IFR04_003131 [Cadophora malorum]
MSSTFGLNGLQLAPSSVILYTLEFFDAITAGGRDKVDTLIASDSVAMIHDSRYVQFEELVEWLRHRGALAIPENTLYSYNSSRIQARRIHSIWQVQHKADAIVVQSLLHDALEDDKLDNGCILSISNYLESNNIPKLPFGKRVTIYPGVAPLSGVFLKE